MTGLAGFPWLRTPVVALLVGTCVCGATLTSAAGAQSAADTATARSQAKQGIALYREGKFLEALDKLQRAQALYDAPVHILFIARCQRDLGRLVEASENYRELSRTSLPSGAPAPFFAAVADGARELKEVNPRIPYLLLTVSPNDAPNLVARVDGTPMPSAAIGIKRPINPGDHRVSVSAEGYQGFAQSVSLAEGAVSEVKVQLVPVGVPPQTETPKEEKSAGEKSAPAVAAGAEEPSSWIGYVLGLRLGVGAPGGQLDPAVLGGLTSEGDSDFGKFAGAAADFQLRAGVRFYRRYGLLLHVGAQSYASEKSEFRGTELDFTGLPAPASGGFNGTVTVPDRPGTGAFGLTGTFSTEPGEFGFFAELGLNLLHTMSHTYVLEGALGRSCSVEFNASGSGLRLGGGLQIPLSDHFQLSPYAAISANGFSETEFTVASDCEFTGGDELSLSTTIDDGPVHTVFALGVGVDYAFGD